MYIELQLLPEVAVIAVPKVITASAAEAVERVTKLDVRANGYLVSATVFASQPVPPNTTESTPATAP
jgi:hypothetical protein